MFALIIDLAEQSAEIEEVEMSGIWSPENSGGWTYQDLEGPHGTFWGVFGTQEEARTERYAVLGF